MRGRREGVMFVNCHSNGLYRVLVVLCICIFFSAPVLATDQDDPNPPQPISGDNGDTNCLSCCSGCQMTMVNACSSCVLLECIGGFGANCEVTANQRMVTCCANCRSMASGSDYCPTCDYVNCHTNCTGDRVFNLVNQILGETNS